MSERSAKLEVYLSRLALNPRNGDVQRDVANCHRLHQRLLRAFPTADGPAARAEFGVLYRPEVDGRTGVVTVLVQSTAAPDWAHLLEVRAGTAHPAYLREGATGERNPECKAVGEVYAAIVAGQTLTFRLRANPTKRLSEHGRTGGQDRLAGKRVALLREEEQLAWLVRKGDEAGFQVGEARVRVDRLTGSDQMGWRPRPGDGGQGERARMTFGAVTFDGVLRVTDPERFRSALVAGIGSGKAYGFGLLSVAPLR